MMQVKSELTAKLLPRDDDEVRIDGLKNAEQHNGKIGAVLCFVEDEGRYKVKLEPSDSSNNDLLGVKLDNLTVISKNDESNKSLHVLIPCHTDSSRRMVTFMRSAKSAVQQVCRDYSVFVGLSGPEKYRKQARTSLSLLAARSPARLYLRDDCVDQRSQMDHLRTLLLGGSLPVNPNALITFLDNDDMCHPNRFYVMLDAYRCNPDMPKESTLALPCKLLLDPSLTPEEGQFQNFANLNNPADYRHWRKCPPARRGKVRLVTNSQAADQDAEEYFDFIVPSAILQKFFQLTPSQVREHRFCDLRLFQILSHMQYFEISDIPDMWMVAHYKIPMEAKRTAFDNHGRYNSQLIHAEDQASASALGSETARGADYALARRFPRLSAQQVAFCRGHIESIVIQYCGWNEKALEAARKEKVAELNRSHGKGFGNALWEECRSTILSLFDSETLKASRGEWTPPH